MHKEYHSEKSPIIDNQKSPNHKENFKNMSVIGFQSWPDVLQHPVTSLQQVSNMSSSKCL